MGSSSSKENWDDLEVLQKYKKSYSDISLRKNIHTLDILVFRDTQGWQGVITKLDKWSHVGIIVRSKKTTQHIKERLEEIQEGKGAPHNCPTQCRHPCWKYKWIDPDDLYIIHSIDWIDLSWIDLLTFEHSKCGVQMHPLGMLIRAFKGDIVYRALHPTKQLVNFQGNIVDEPSDIRLPGSSYSLQDFFVNSSNTLYETNIWELVGAYLFRNHRNYCPEGSTNTLFCSEFTAMVYKRLRILPQQYQESAPNAWTPHMFMEQNDPHDPPTWSDPVFLKSSKDVQETSVMTYNGML